MSGRDTAPPLTPEQTQLARGLIAEWFEAEVREAEAKLAAAEAAVQKAHAARRAWQGGERLTDMQVILCEAAQQGLYQQAAQRFLAGAGSRDEAEGLRASCDVLSRYLREAYGDDTSREYR